MNGSLETQITEQGFFRCLSSDVAKICCSICSDDVRRDGFVVSDLIAQASACRLEQSCSLQAGLSCVAGDIAGRL